jgi:hypothetical protein
VVEDSLTVNCWAQTLFADKRVSAMTPNIQHTIFIETAVYNVQRFSRVLIVKNARREQATGYAAERGSDTNCIEIGQVVDPRKQ